MAHFWRVAWSASGILLMVHEKAGSWLLHAYLNGDQSNNEREENHLFSIPALLAIHFYFAFQFPSLATVTHENLKKKNPLIFSRNLLSWCINTINRTGERVWERLEELVAQVLPFHFPSSQKKKSTGESLSLSSPNCSFLVLYPSPKFLTSCNLMAHNKAARHFIPFIGKVAG